jgi:hypothetical protein
MEAFAWFAAALYIVTSGVLGAGLWRLSRTRGGSAAGCLAAALLSASVLQSLSIVAAAADAGRAPLHGVWRLVFVALYAATGVSASCMMRFTQIVYRPRQRLLTAVPVGVALTFAYVALGVPFRSGAPLHSWSAFSVYAVLLAGYLWTAAESFRCWRGYRRARDLDPVVVERFRLWGASALAIVLWVAVAFVGQNRAWARGVGSGFGVVSSVALWFAFQPPAFYQRWLRSRGATAS